MILCDVNIFVYAFKRDEPRHKEYLAWLDGAVNGNEPFGVSELVLSSFVRIVTHPKIFPVPESLDTVFRHVRRIRNGRGTVPVSPGPRHWEIFEGLCRSAVVRGNLVTDAYLAALAIENGCEWITADRDFARFPGLRWRHPLDGS